MTVNSLNSVELSQITWKIWKTNERNYTRDTLGWWIEYTENSEIYFLFQAESQDYITLNPIHPSFPLGQTGSLKYEEFWLLPINGPQTPQSQSIFSICDRCISLINEKFNLLRVAKWKRDVYIWWHELSPPGIIGLKVRKSSPHWPF